MRFAEGGKAGPLSGWILRQLVIKHPVLILCSDKTIWFMMAGDCPTTLLHRSIVFRGFLLPQAPLVLFLDC